MNRVVFTAFMACTALASGCASLSNNVTQPVIVATTCGDVPVQGAMCRIINAHGAWTVNSTPASVMIRRAPSDLAIDCKMPSGASGQAMPVLSESYASRAAWGNLLGFLVVGWSYDAYRDAAWKYDSEYTVDMCKGVPPGVSKQIQTSAREQSDAVVAPLAGMTSTVGGQQKYAFSAEALAKQKQCSATPKAVLNARGPATEVYTVPCSNGETMMLKCTWGDCKSI